jgi:hypothetical protein
MADTVRFPFCPSVSWTLKKDKSINCGLVTPNELNSLWSNDSINVICQSGLLDTLLSLSIFEYGFSLSGYKKYQSICSSNFKQLIELQGLAQSSSFEDNIDNFPTPVFYKDNQLYFNTSFNNLYHLKFNGEVIREQKTLTFNLLIKNLLFPWANKFLPVLRNLTDDDKLLLWAKNNKIQLEKSFVLILPERLNYSNCNLSFLNWNLSYLKALHSMLQARGIQCIIMGNVNLYNGLPFIKFDFNHYFKLLQKTQLVMSEDFDLLALAVLYSNSKVAAKKYSTRYSIDTIKSYFKQSNKLLSLSEIYPIDVFDFLQ